MTFLIRWNHTEQHTADWTEPDVTTKALEQAEATVLTMVAKLSDEALCIAWMATEGQTATKELAITRGWLLNELNQRLGDDLFDEWLMAVDENGDSPNPLAFCQR